MRHLPLCQSWAPPKIESIVVIVVPERPAENLLCRKLEASVQMDHLQSSFDSWSKATGLNAHGEFSA